MLLLSFLDTKTLYFVIMLRVCCGRTVAYPTDQVTSRLSVLRRECEAFRMDDGVSCLEPEGTLTPDEGYLPPYQDMGV